MGFHTARLIGRKFERCIFIAGEAVHWQTFSKQRGLTVTRYCPVCRSQDTDHPLAIFGYGYSRSRSGYIPCDQSY